MDGPPRETTAPESAAHHADHLPLAGPDPRPIRRRGLAMRLLGLVLLFSLSLSLVSTSALVYRDYQHELGDIEDRLQEIESSRLNSLAGSLWHMDTAQIRLELEGILKLPDMQALEVREVFNASSKPVVIAVGTRAGRDELARVYPIIYGDRGQPRVVGHLYVEATLDGVYGRLKETAMVTLVSQVGSILLMSLFILYVVWRLVTRHLVTIATYLRHYDVHAPAPTLRLIRRAPREPDELDDMVAAFNSLCVGLEAAYQDLTRTNLALERDIEDRKAAEAQVVRLNRELETRVRQRTAELEGANQELSTFSYSVSHDLRAPLRRIEGFVSILFEEYGVVLDARGKHCLERIRSGTRDMAGMIDSFLKLSRATTGELQVEPIDLSSVAGEIVAELTERHPDHPVSVEIQPGLEVKGDRRLMSAAIANLLENSWKFTRGRPDPKVTFGTCEKDGRQVFFVTDNGSGFDMAFVDRLFAPFNRLPNAEGMEGVGIGLATVHRVIVRHGGKVWAEGTPGQGATFYFTCWEGMRNE
ncbi:MAG: two-component sensor histidine kinase [Alphaproteobacteria bacterium]|nr:two-component sensor histidine kinase [Alphaproteobacteria bacterium]